MAALSGWLQQIIAVVLLASLVDLLLPNQTMQRYVRLIAGLFILLTLASPALNWIKSDFGTKLAADLESVRLRPEANPEQLAMIESDAAKLQMSREEQAASLASAQLASQIRQTVEAEGRVSVKDVQVKLTAGADGARRAANVKIVVGEPGYEGAGEGASEGTETGGTSREVTPIREVDPVVIEIEPIGSGDQGTTEEAVPASAEPVSEEDLDLQQRVASLVSARYGMEQSRIQVEVNRSVEKS